MNLITYDTPPQRGTSYPLIGATNKPPQQQGHTQLAGATYQYLNGQAQNHFPELKWIHAYHNWIE